VGRDKLSVSKLNKGTLVYSHGKGQGPLGKPSMIIITKAMKNKSKKQFPTWSQTGFLPAAEILYVSF